MGTKAAGAPYVEEDHQPDQGDRDRDVEVIWHRVMGMALSRL